MVLVDFDLSSFMFSGAGVDGTIPNLRKRGLSQDIPSC